MPESQKPISIQPILKQIIIFDYLGVLIYKIFNYPRNLFELQFIAVQFE